MMSNVCCANVTEVVFASRKACLDNKTVKTRMKPGGAKSEVTYCESSKAHA
jgi:hypothetical protein